MRVDENLKKYVYKDLTIEDELRIITRARAFLDSSMVEQPAVNR